MTNEEFVAALDARIAKYDLLCHPFYQTWTKGELTRDNLRDYAMDYYHHVAAFPDYLSRFADRLEDGHMKNAVLANMREENGQNAIGEQIEPVHADLWLDFAQESGASRHFPDHKPVAEISSLMGHFNNVAAHGTPEQAFATFYAYESQVPHVAEEKARGLRDMYGMNDKACGYFDLHKTADIYHSRVWLNQILRQVKAAPEQAADIMNRALDAAEDAAKALWNALDGILQERILSSRPAYVPVHA